jgi:hypothetical protein
MRVLAPIQCSHNWSVLHFPSNCHHFSRPSQIKCHLGQQPFPRRTAASARILFAASNKLNVIKLGFSAYVECDTDVTKIPLFGNLGPSHRGRSRFAGVPDVKGNLIPHVLNIMNETAKLDGRIR